MRARHHGLRRAAVPVLVLLVTAAIMAGIETGVFSGAPGGGTTSAEAGRAEDAGRPSETSARSTGPTGWDPSPGSVAAVGDSITRGFDACTLLADCPDASWATGSGAEVRSLAVRLLEDPAGRSWNYAVSGSRMDGLAAQMRRAAARDPDLVTVMTGANDACRTEVDRMTPVAVFRASFRRALQALWDRQPETQVYVASIPDLKRLWSQGRSRPEAVRAWEFGLCPSMLHNPRSSAPADEQRRDRVHERVKAYNGVLAEECARHARCRYDGGAVFRYPFTTEHLSEWDWFHPGRMGQRELAALAHRLISAPA